MSPPPQFVFLTFKKKKKNFWSRKKIPAFLTVVKKCFEFWIPPLNRCVIAVTTNFLRKIKEGEFQSTKLFSSVLFSFRRNRLVSVSADGADTRGGVLDVKRRHKEKWKVQHSTQILSLFSFFFSKRKGGRKWSVTDDTFPVQSTVSPAPFSFFLSSICTWN